VFFYYFFAKYSYQEYNRNNANIGYSCYVQNITSYVDNIINASDNYSASDNDSDSDNDSASDSDNEGNHTYKEIERLNKNIDKNIKLIERERIIQQTHQHRDKLEEDYLREGRIRVLKKTTDSLEIERNKRRTAWDKEVKDSEAMPSPDVLGGYPRSQAADSTSSNSVINKNTNNENINKNNDNSSYNSNPVDTGGVGASEASGPSYTSGPSEASTSKKHTLSDMDSVESNQSTDSKKPKTQQSPVDYTIEEQACCPTDLADLDGGGD